MGQNWTKAELSTRWLLQPWVRPTPTFALDGFSSSFPKAEFLTNYYDHELWHAPGAADIAVTKARIWDTLEHSRFDPKLTLLLVKGRPLDHALYSDVIARYGDSPIASRRISRPKVARLMEHGATLVMRSIDEVDTNLSVLASSLEWNFDCRVFVDLYANSANAPQGTTPHWDDNDTIALQLWGTKRWLVHGPGRINPLRAERARNECPKEVMMDVELQTGDVLYVPKGHWHGVTPTSQESGHLAISLRHATGHDFLQWLVSLAVENEQVRQPLKANRVSLDPDYALSCVKGLGESHFLADLAAKATPHWLPTPRGPETDQVSFTSPRRTPLLWESGMLHVMALGYEWTFDSSTAPFVEKICTIRSMSLAEVTDLLDDTGVVDELEYEGFLVKV